jgi:WD40 repeat protein
MFRWFTMCVILALVVGGFYLVLGMPRPSGQGEAPKPEGPRAGPASKVVHGGEAHAAESQAPATPDPGQPPIVGAVPSIVIPEGRIAAIDKQEVPSQRDGQLLFIGTEVTPDEASKLPDDMVVRYKIGYLVIRLRPGEKEEKKIPSNQILQMPDLANNSDGRKDEYRRLEEDDRIPPGSKVVVKKEERFFKRLREGDEVREGQLLGLVNPSLALDDLYIKVAKLDASAADENTSIKTRDEAEQRYMTNFKLYQGGHAVVSLEEVRASKLAWDRYIYEVISKGQAINVAAAELKQAQTTLEMHSLRSKVRGSARIKVIYKHKGDAVKNLDPVMQIFNPKKLRIEGLVELQHVGLLHEGMQVVVEPTRYLRPETVLRGHLHPVNGVAVSKRLDVVSASDDKNVFVWDRATRETKLILPHPSQVKAVACTPLDAPTNLCLTGAADGVARLWDLDAKGSAAVELKDGHKGQINCVAFGPQGTWCATGGSDRAICLWDTASGQLVQKLAAGQSRAGSSAGGPTTGHRGEVTSVAFLSPTRLVSAGSDRLLLVWTLGADGSLQGLPDVIDRRSGDVHLLGVSPKNQTVLLDQGKELRVLTLPERKTLGLLQNSSGAMNFTTMALFSPGGQLILTAGGSEGRLQLWRAPTGQRRAHELCQLISPAATCGAFAPDGSFLVTGSVDRQVFVWQSPTEEQMRELTATVTFIEQSLDSNSRQVRIWADLDKPQDLIPGAIATMVVYPTH